MAEKQEKKQTNKKALIGAAALIAVIAVLAVVFFVFREKPVQGQKSVTIEVIDNTQSSTVYEVHTDAEYLRQAMEEAKGLEFFGTESEYGLMVETINGVTPDYNVDGAYWSFYVTGAYCNYGIDSQPVEDGDAFVIKYEMNATE